MSIFTVVLGWSHLGSIIAINEKNSSAEENSFQIVSYNAQSLEKIRNKKGVPDKELKVGYLEYLNAIGSCDIFCIQETSRWGVHTWNDDLKYPYRHGDDKASSTIFSKFPIIKKGKIDVRTDKAESHIWADIKVKNDTVRVYSIHFQSNKISYSTAKVLEDPDLQSSKTWKSVRGILANYKNSSIIRTQQATAISEHILKSPYKTIVCGDFNDTPLSHMYKILAKDKKDSFKESGSGIGTTFGGVIPALRIDYILADKRLDIIDHQIHKGNYSDHYPISAHVILPSRS